MSKNITSKFKFIGELQIPVNEEVFFKAWSNEKNLEMAKIGFSIKESSANRGFVELFGMKTKTIYTVNTENQKIEVPWDDRNNDEVKKLVANYKKYTIDLGADYGERQEFITQYDAIMFLREWLPEYKGKLYISGVWERDVFNGKFKNRFNIQSVYAIEDKAKPKLELTADLYYNADSIDSTELAKERRIYVNAYVRQYLRAEKAHKFIPTNVILDGNKYDLSNDKHLKLWEYKTNCLTGDSAGLLKKKMSHLTWSCRLINGAEEVDFDESMLTEAQKEQVALGINEVNDFKPKGPIQGEKISEIRLAEPVLLGEFNDGAVYYDETLEEFLEKVYRGEPADEKIEDVVELKESVDEPSAEDDGDDLF